MKPNEQPRGRDHGVSRSGAKDEVVLNANIVTLRQSHQSIKYDNKNIAVIIPTYNSVKTVVKTIESLLNQTLPAKQIIVVNNASSDNTANVLNNLYGKKIKLVNLNKNLGVTGGRNTGIKYLDKKIDYVCFLDHDMQPDKQMLDQLMMALNSRKQCGIVTPKIYYLSEKKHIWAAGTGINLWTGQVLFRGGKDEGQYDLNEEVQVAPAAMLMKKEVIQKIKKFDPRYFATFEDTDFCFRAKKAGFDILYAAKAVAYHDLPIDKKQESIRLLGRAYWVGRNRILFMKDFGKNFLVFLLFLPIFGLYYLKLALIFNKPKSFYQFLKGTVDGLRGV